MSAVTIDAGTGCLVIDGATVFPIGLSDPPPQDGKTRDGKDAWAEIAAAGVNMIRSGRRDWALSQIDNQIAAEKTRMDAAAAHGLRTWLRLGIAANLPAPTSSGPSVEEQLLVKVANGLEGHAALAVYKGADEPANSGIAPAGLVRAYRKLKALDPNHPVEMTQAPVFTGVALAGYRPAFDITGADIYPVSYGHPHGDLPNHDISVVGDATKKMVKAAGGKPIWMTLQIAWSGTIPRQQHADIVPRFPTLHEERFMAYQAIVNGARGLVFFGGQLTQVMRPRDAQLGWNWWFWELVLRPLLLELSSSAVRPALVARSAPVPVTTTAADVEVATRLDGTFLHVIAVRRSATSTGRVELSGVPHKPSGAEVTAGQVMFEYAQEPLPPPVQPDKQKFRPVKVAGGSFSDWFGPHDVHVYRFNLA